MKPGSSTLNPNAAAYIPISKRNPEPEENYSKAFLPGGYQGKSQEQNLYSSLSSYGGPSRNVNKTSEDRAMKEQSDAMALDYLMMEFTDVSEDFIAHAFSFNNENFDVTYHMLLDLVEPDRNESPGSLPDTLDIGDVSESNLSGQCASLKLKNVPVIPKGSPNSAGSSQVII